MADNIQASKEAPTPAAFRKYQILTFMRYADRRDLLSVLLKDDAEYTLEQVDHLIQNFMRKGKVK